VPSNQQRREAAKRKLQRQLVRRQQRAVAQRRRLMIVGVAAAVLVIAGGVWLFSTIGNNTASGDSTSSSSADGSTTSSAPPSSTAPATPCSYPTDGTPAKKVDPPTNLSPANTGTVDAKVTLNTGTLTFQLDRANAPCAVESFLSLASQKYYNDTPCHRLTTASTLKVLQSGDPSGTGTGGPGYSFGDELTGSEKYTAGTLAMANGGPNTNGSQFFIVYGDSQLDPNYTVLGKVTQGLDVVKAIAEKGAVKDKKPAQDGAPAEKVTIESVTVPSASVTATGNYQTTGTAASTIGAPATTGSAASTAGSAATSAAAGSSAGTTSVGQGTGSETSGATGSASTSS
jgi:peptidyl-prolyl cis-trans isomerase B (cyclophilin B)